MSYSASSWGRSCSGGSADKLVSLTDANNNITRYEYNLNGELVKETDPRGNITSSYDVSGRLSRNFHQSFSLILFKTGKCAETLLY